MGTTMQGLRSSMVWAVCAASIGLGACRRDVPTPELLNAARWNQQDTVERLLSAGADVNARDSDGRTALHMAARYGHVEIAQSLLRHGASVDVRSSSGGDTPLFLAVGSVWAPVVRLLLDHGADPSIRTADGWSLLHSAAAVDEVDLRTQPRGAEHVEIVHMLLAHGADVNSTDRSGASPLFYAALKSHRNVMELLLDAGANVNARTDYSTPLIIAVRAHDAQAVDLLLKHGADPSVEPRYRPSALALTAEDESATAIHAMLSAALPRSASAESQEIKCDVPAWVPVYPGTTPKPSVCSQTSEGFEARYEFVTADAASKVIAYYRQELTRRGFRVNVQSDRSDRGFIRSEHPDGHRFIVLGARTVSRNRTEGMLQVTHTN